MIKTIPLIVAVLSLTIAGATRADDAPGLDVPPTAEPLHVSIDAPDGSAFQLVESDDDQAPIPTSVSVDRNQLIATIPPADKPRRFQLEAIEATPASPFQISDLNDRSVEIREGEKPILVYNHGVISREGAPKEQARSSYVHPLYGIDGEVISDDFPRDHYHHRGLFWAWPQVSIDGEKYDLWLIKGIRHKFERWLARETGPASATLGVENGWYVGDRRVLLERVWIDVHPTQKDARAIDLALTLIPEDSPVTLDGAPGKSYGGLNLRYGPGQSVKITTPLGDGPDDLLMTRLPWADLSARFNGDRPSGAAIFVAPDHPDFPPTWLTRHYGVLCVGWPGVTPKTLAPNQPTTLRYRLWIHQGPANAQRLAKVAEALNAGENLKWTTPETDKP